MGGHYWRKVLKNGFLRLPIGSMNPRAPPVAQQPAYTFVTMYLAHLLLGIEIIKMLIKK